MRVYKVRYRAAYKGDIVIGGEVHVRAEGVEDAMKIAAGLVEETIPGEDDDGKDVYSPLEEYSTREVIDCGIELAN